MVMTPMQNNLVVIENDGGEILFAELSIENHLTGDISNQYVLDSDCEWVVLRERDNNSPIMRELPMAVLKIRATTTNWWWVHHHLEIGGNCQRCR
jgi:expansin (peptidoglycan-binding protein)